MIKMRVFTIFVIILCALGGLELRSAPFQNLDFESATFVPIPNDLYQRVFLDSALPYWTGHVGTNELGAVLHNAEYLNSTGIDIQDAGWYSGFVPLQGSFSVLLEAGNTLDTREPVDISLSQTGFVPLNAMSLRFRGQLYSPTQFAVSLGGENLDVTTFPSDGSPGTLYGADVSGLAGQTLPLTFTVFAQRPVNRNLLLDAIEFSPLPVPEPGTLALFALGTAFGVGFWIRTKRRKHQKVLEL